VSRSDEDDDADEGEASGFGVSVVSGSVGVPATGVLRERLGFLPSGVLVMATAS
jgi:hypothetical protein